MLRNTLVPVLFALCIAAPPAYPDPKVDSLLKKVRERATAAQTLEAVMVATFTTGAQRQTYQATIQLKKPNLARISVTGLPGGEQLLVSDGTTLYQASLKRKQYRKQEARGRGENVVSMGIPFAPERLFFTPELLTMRGKVLYAGTTQRNGKRYEVIDVTSPTPPQRRKLYVGPSGLIEGLEMAITGQVTPQTTLVWLKELRIDAPIAPNQFSYQPPAGFRAEEDPASR